MATPQRFTSCFHVRLEIEPSPTRAGNMLLPPLVGLPFFHFSSGDFGLNPSALYSPPFVQAVIASFLPDLPAGPRSPVVPKVTVLLSRGLYTWLKSLELISPCSHSQKITRTQPGV